MKENIVINTELLVNYAHGMLEPELAQYVKIKMEQDTFLQQQYNGIVAMMKDCPDEDIEALVNGYASVTELKKSKATFTLRHNTKWYAVAASVIFFIGLGWWIFSTNNKHGGQLACLSLTDLLQKEHKYVPQVRDISNDTSAWLNSFNLDQYDKTIQLLSSPSQPLKPTEQYYLALSYLYSNPPNYDAASKQFRAYIASGAIALESKCHLYLGAIALQQNNLKDARTELEQVSLEDKAQAEFLLRNTK